jgi:hypothetical protein
MELTMQGGFAREEKCDPKRAGESRGDFKALAV